MAQPTNAPKCGYEANMMAEQQDRPIVEKAKDALNTAGVMAKDALNMASEKAKDAYCTAAETTKGLVQQVQAKVTGEQLMTEEEKMAAERKLQDDETRAIVDQKQRLDQHLMQSAFVPPQPTAAHCHTPHGCVDCASGQKPAAQPIL
uniref:Uncharacterized protein n=1 Tax=Plectus sambesii TaxID=2011161 RepID=A0A914WSZ5_9BILA